LLKKLKIGLKLKKVLANWLKKKRLSLRNWRRNVKQPAWKLRNSKFRNFICIDMIERLNKSRER